MAMEFAEELLSAAEEIALARSIEVGVYARQLLSTGGHRRATEAELKVLVAEGVRARERFVRANLRLVMSVCVRAARLHGLNRDELFQEGVIGLLIAVDRFDAERGLRFATYALPWIRETIQEACATRCGQGHLSANATRVRRAARAAQNRLEAQGLRPTVAEIAAAVNESATLVAEVLDQEAPVSLSSGAFEGVWDREDPRAHAAVTRIVDEQGQRVDLGVLEEAERRVVHVRFGFDGEPRTLETTAAVLGLSRSTVKRRERRALERLREWQCQSQAAA